MKLRLHSIQRDFDDSNIIAVRLAILPAIQTMDMGTSGQIEVMLELDGLKQHTLEQIEQHAIAKATLQLYGGKVIAGN